MQQRQAFGHVTEEKSKTQPFQTKGSGAPKSHTSHLALAYRSGIIQPWAFVNGKNAKGLATRRINSGNNDTKTPTRKPDVWGTHFNSSRDVRATRPSGLESPS
jgi:hypothetical protein